MPFPELNLSLGLTDNKGAIFYSGEGEGKIVVRTDSGLKQHTITIVISEKEIGVVNLKTGVDHPGAPTEIELPLYQMTVTDDKTNEMEVYKVTRDTFLYKEQTTQKGLWGFLGLNFMVTKNYLFENNAFEPLSETLENFDITRKRILKNDQLSYTFEKNNEMIQIYAGDINGLDVQKGIRYFIIVDENKGQRFLGDILYREKVLKITPKVCLTLIKRKKILKNIEVKENGKTNKVVYF